MLNFIKTWLADQAVRRQLQSIKTAVDSRITYEDGGFNDWKYIPVDQTAYGDCQVFTETYRKQAEYAGFTAVRHTYKLPDGQWHAVCCVRTDNGTYVIDCRKKYVEKES